MFSHFLARAARLLVARGWPATAVRSIVAAALSAGALAAGAAPAGAAACTTTGSGDVTDFCLTPSGTQAGSDPTLSTAIDFNYAKPGDSVKDVSVTLPPGLLAIPTAVPAQCTYSQLTAGSCPSGSQVGSGTVSASALNGLASVNATSEMFAMPVSACATATAVACFGVDSWVLAPSGAPQITLLAPASLTLVGGQPAVRFGFSGIPDTVTGLSIQVNSLTLNIDGTVSSGSPFTRLPTSCAPATTTLSIDTYAGSSDGSGSSTFTPTGCGSVPFTPALSASSQQDSGDPGASLTTTITQPSGQAAPSSIGLRIPAATLQPDLTNAPALFGDVVGSVSATTPVLAAPSGGPLTVTGPVKLTGNVLSPSLQITLPLPGQTLTLTGSVDLASNSVQFSGLPDVPLSSLAVTLDGGSEALYESSCANPRGTVTGDFTGQNGATATPTAPVTVANCTQTPPPNPAPPCTTAGTGDVSNFCLTPSGTQAGSDATLSTAIDFSYANSTDTVKDVTVTLPTGLLAIPTAVPVLCTPSQLSGGNCPAASQVGSGMVIANALGLSTSSYSAMYAMAIPAGDTTDVAYFGIDSWLGSSPPSPGTAPLITLTAPASLVLAGPAPGQPAVKFGFSNIPSSVTIAGLPVPIQVQSLTLNIDGTAPSASGGASTTAFTRLPTSCAPATTTLSIDTYAGSANGSGSSTFTPTGCDKLAFTPALSASSTRNANDLGASFATAVTQPSGQAAASSMQLTIPALTLAPDLINAATSFGDVVGTATAVTPVLPGTLSGPVKLTGSVASPKLQITLPLPGLTTTLTGSVDILANSVQFTGLPDVPLSSLTVTINGGSDALYATTCAAPTGSVDGVFTGQNGVTVKPSATFTVAGCSPPPVNTGPANSSPATTTTSTTPTTPTTPPTTGSAKHRPPHLTGGSLKGLATGNAVLRFVLIAGSARVRSFTVSLPSGLSFAVRSFRHGVSVRGGRVRSLKLLHGRLAVTLRSPASHLIVMLSAKALDERPALRGRVRSRKVHRLRAVLLVRDASGHLTRLVLVLRV